jgi:hypothetical protein
MPRKSSPLLKSENVHTQTFAQTNLKQSAQNCHTHPRKAAKTRGSCLPVPKVLRIQQRYLNGQNKTEIAREEECDRETVTRIVQFPEVQNYIAQAQRDFFGLIPDAMKAVRHALRIEKNAMIGLTVLERTGVTAYRGERMQLPETTASESGFERQARLVASVLLEAHEKLGVDLPEDVTAALEKDARESAEAINASAAKVPRR